MSVMTWLHEKLGYRQPEDSRFGAAIAATSELTTMARSLRQQLEPYRREDDPFASIMRKHDMAQKFDEGQIRDIHHGPPR